LIGRRKKHEKDFSSGLIVPSDMPDDKIQREISFSFFFEKYKDFSDIVSL
jgi:hypothetical protein